jgi:hypothetical protein
MRSLSKLAPMMLGVMTVAGCAADSTEDESNASDNAIVGGTLDTHSDHDPVVAIWDKTQSEARCTGTFISPRVVVTAEHCVSGINPRELEVRRGPDSKRPTAKYKIKQYEEVTAEGREGAAGWGADVAFIILKDPVNDVVPIAMFDRSLDARDLGASFLLVGYGQTSANLNADAGRRRQNALGTLTLVSGFVRENALDPATVAPTAGPKLRDGYEAQVEDTGAGFGCTGDSGGPHLVRIAGKLTIMALTSAQSKTRNECTSKFTIVSSFGPEVQAAKARALAAQ